METRVEVENLADSFVLRGDRQRKFQNLYVQLCYENGTVITCIIGITKIVL